MDLETSNDNEAGCCQRCGHAKESRFYRYCTRCFLWLKDVQRRTQTDLFPPSPPASAA